MKLLLMTLSHFLLETALNLVVELCRKNRLLPVNCNVCIMAKSGHAALSAWTVGLWSLVAGCGVTTGQALQNGPEF